MRVTKNILEAEDNQDENGKLWFSENHIPLYLVRDFEQKAGVSSSPSPGMIISNSFTNFYQRRVKATIGDIFFYLFHKGDVYSCSSCKKDVAFRYPQLFFSCHCIFLILFLYSNRFSSLLICVLLDESHVGMSQSVALVKVCVSLLACPLSRFHFVLFFSCVVKKIISQFPSCPIPSHNFDSHK